MSIEQPTTTMEGAFAVNVKVALLPDRRDEFVRVIQTDAEQTLQTEPGALQFTWGVDTTTNENNVFYFHEQYKTKSDFDSHCTTSHYKAWKEFCNSQPFVTDPIVQFYKLFPRSQQHDDHPVLQDKTVVGQPRATFCLNAELCIKPTMRDAFLAVARHDQEGSLEHPLCIQYDFGESIDTPNTFYFHEQYTGDNNGKEGFDVHRASSHFAKWQEFMALDPFTNPYIVDFFRTYPVVKPTIAD